MLLCVRGDRGPLGHLDLFETTGFRFEHFLCWREMQLRDHCWHDRGQNHDRDEGAVLHLIDATFLFISGERLYA